MHQELIAFNKQQRTAKQDYRVGDVVRVHRRIKEGNKERTQVFEGMIIVVRGGQSSSPMITVRKVSNSVGVEIIVPTISPMIEKIEVLKHAKTRRANLGFVRSKPAKKLRFKYEDAATTAARRAVKSSATDVLVGATEVDDLTKIEGIGPKIAEVFAQNGLMTFADVAAAEQETMEKILADNGLAQHTPATWAQQAALARDGAWESLEQMQGELRGGKPA